MGLVKLRIREFAGKQGWTLKEVSERSGVPYGTIKTYALSDGMAMADVTGFSIFVFSTLDKLGILDKDKQFLRNS